MCRRLTDFNDQLSRATVTPVDGSANLNGDLHNTNPGAQTRRFERRGLSGSRQVFRIYVRVQKRRAFDLFEQTWHDPTAPQADSNVVTYWTR